MKSRTIYIVERPFAGEQFYKLQLVRETMSSVGVSRTRLVDNEPLRFSSDLEALERKLSELANAFNTEFK